MAYTYTNSRGTTYTLQAKTATLKNGNAQTIFFFSRRPGEGALDRVPPGYEVIESRNGLPMLKRKEEER